MKILSILLQILLEELFCVLTCLKIQKSGWGMFYSLYWIQELYAQ